MSNEDNQKSYGMAILDLVFEEVRRGAVGFSDKGHPLSDILITRIKKNVTPKIKTTESVYMETGDLSPYSMISEAIKAIQQFSFISFENKNKIKAQLEDVLAPIAWIIQKQLNKASLESTSDKFLLRKKSDREHTVYVRTCIPGSDQWWGSFEKALDHFYRVSTQIDVPQHQSYHVLEMRGTIDTMKEMIRQGRNEATRQQEEREQQEQDRPVTEINMEPITWILQRNREAQAILRDLLSKLYQEEAPAYLMQQLKKIKLHLNAIPKKIRSIPKYSDQQKPPSTDEGKNVPLDRDNLITSLEVISTLFLDSPRCICCGAERPSVKYPLIPSQDSKNHSEILLAEIKRRSAIYRDSKIPPRREIARKDLEILYKNLHCRTFDELEKWFSWNDEEPEVCHLCGAPSANQNIFEMNHQEGCPYAHLFLLWNVRKVLKEEDER